MTLFQLGAIRVDGVHSYDESDALQPSMHFPHASLHAESPTLKAVRPSDIPNIRSGGASRKFYAK